MRDEQWDVSSFGGDPIGSVRTYGPAAFENLGGLNLCKKLPTGWVRPNFQVLAKSDHAELSELLDSALTYTPTIVSSPSWSNSVGINFGEFINGAYYFGAIGSNNHMAGFALRSGDGSSFSTVASAGAYFIKHVGGNNLISSLQYTATGFGYSYSTDNGVSFTHVTIDAGTMGRTGAAEFDGVNYYVFRPDNKYYRSPNIATITAMQTGNWDKLSDIFRLGGRWIAVLDRTSQGGGCGVFTSDDNMATWVSRRAQVAASVDFNTYALSRHGTRLFLCGVGYGVIAYSDNNGTSWTDVSVPAGSAGWNCMAQRSPAFDGVLMLFGQMLSEDGGATWKRWVINPAHPYTYLYGWGVPAANPGSAGSMRLAATQSASTLHIMSVARAFAPETHLQIPSSASYPGIPFPIMRVK